MNILMIMSCTSQNYYWNLKATDAHYEEEKHYMEIIVTA